MTVFLALKYQIFAIFLFYFFILTKNFELQAMNRYCPEKHQELFPKFAVHIFQQKTRFLLAKRDFNIFKIGKQAIRGSLRRKICR